MTPINFLEKLTFWLFCFKIDQSQTPQGNSNIDCRVDIYMINFTFEGVKRNVALKLPFESF